MYLKSLEITNFRKFGSKENVIEFVDAKSNLQQGINIASATTLIVGKNNSGKTTIIKALEKLTSISPDFKANDFNFTYLNRLLRQYSKKHFINMPTLCFKLIIGFDKKIKTDLVTNIFPFMTIENTNGLDKQSFEINIRYKVEEKETFKTNVNIVLGKYNKEEKKHLLFQKFLEVINETLFELKYFNSNNEEIEKSKFKLANLINVEHIRANKNINDTSLSEAFNKIIKNRGDLKKVDLDESIEKINKDITDGMEEFNSTSINKVLHKIEDSKRFEVRLSSDLTLDKLIKSLIKYQYSEQGLDIPEGQFGLGYANLISIIGYFIDYIEQYPDDETNSKLNLIFIEEPEVFMHPQMQELFIKNINDAIKELLDDSTKKINTQTVVTTHSAHIFNSKIHTSNSFDNISYISTIENEARIVNLHDETIITSERDSRKRANDLKFIKKHMKFKVSDMFFADAIIFVEGITEETLLSFYIDNHDSLGLNKYYIAIFNINGAHGLVYHDLIKLLKIPTIIITDLDIERTYEEKNAESPKKEDNLEYLQISSLDKRKTKNSTIKKYKGNDDISNIPTYFEDENLYITYQSEKLEEYYATSLEEAFILQNYDNDILNNAIKKVKPKIYKNIIGDPENRKKLLDNSYKLQKKLSKSKSDFANTLLYELSIEDNQNKHPKLPNYINNALVWLKTKLAPTNSGE
ncbi:ATP-dependent nuclease [Francisella philomiragia]|uniref:AAA family ATPase n=1 Tax=Francisella philomiragia TaxID=28110 RepID=A0ABS1G9Y8_9GAMM|nr:AAA family ATPase [Francisella philomiragia]MBK2257671.1 AAA family ATPase [Francisella philomiragia]MBK2301359.1 AAA family ATPase [Francisella philomiragia]